MAITHKMLDNPLNIGSYFDGTLKSPWDVNSVQHVIQGKMIKVSQNYSNHDIMYWTKDSIKQDLAIKLAEELIAGGYVEFTQMEDNFGMYNQIRARCFVVPDDRVRLLRLNGYEADQK